MQCTIDGKRVCPQCEYEIKDPEVLRCPRCNHILLLKCSECQKCGIFKGLS